MATVRVWWLDNDSLRFGGTEQLAEACASGSWCWVDVSEPDEASLNMVAERFGLHPLEVEDVLHKQHRPKLDLFPQRLHVMWVFLCIFPWEGVPFPNKIPPLWRYENNVVAAHDRRLKFPLDLAVDQFFGVLENYVHMRVISAK